MSVALKWKYVLCKIHLSIHIYICVGHSKPTGTFLAAPPPSLFLGSEVTLHIRAQTGSSVAPRLKWPPSPNKDASPLEAPHSSMNLVTPPPPRFPLHPPPSPLQSVLPAPTVSLWKWSVPERWVEPLHVYIGPRGIPACPLLLLSFVSQMDTN